MTWILKFTLRSQLEAASNMKLMKNQGSLLLIDSSTPHSGILLTMAILPGTKGGDGDPLDVVVLSSEPVVPGVVMKCHAVGVLETEDEEGIDAKVIAVPTKKIDPLYGVYENIKDVPEALLAKIKHFYENYKTIEPGKWVKVKDFKNAVEAEKEIESSKV